jgi:hypothetical protein
MDTAALVQLARSIPRSEFVAMFTNLFFVTTIEHGTQIEFQTVVLDRATRRSTPVPPRAITPAGGMPLRPSLPSPPAIPSGVLGAGGLPIATAVNVEAIEVVKAPGNPYPDRISIGRARNCDIVLRDPSVSKLHAHARPKAGQTLSLVDVGSHNGTRVNGQRLEPNEPRDVGPGDLIVFGGLAGRLSDAAALYEFLSRG